MQIFETPTKTKTGKSGTDVSAAGDTATLNSRSPQRKRKLFHSELSLNLQLEQENKRFPLTG